MYAYLILFNRRQQASAVFTNTPLSY